MDSVLHVCLNPSVGNAAQWPVGDGTYSHTVFSWPVHLTHRMPAHILQNLQDHIPHDKEGANQADINGSAHAHGRIHRQRNGQLGILEVQ